jgi:gliding motility-associated-like protein
MVLCNGASTGSINLTVSGGTSPYTFDWSNDGTGDFNDTEDLSGLPAGTYTVVVNDANGSTSGCTATTTVTITQPAELVILSAIPTMVLCSGASTGAIDILVTGGIAPYTYDWDNDGTGDFDDAEDLTALPAGTYTVVVNDASGSSTNCVAVETVTITQPAAPVTLNAIPTMVLCNGESTGSINLTVSGGTSPYTFDWSNDGTGDFNDTEDLSALPAGSYTVVVNDTNGSIGSCNASTTINITQPALPLSVVLTSQTNILCNGGATGAISVTASGGTPNYTYSWTGPNGFTSNTEDPTGLVAGAYTLTVTDANGTTGGCFATLPVTLTQPALPLSVVLTSQTNILCNGGATGAISVTASGGTPNYTYSWTGPNGFTSNTEDPTGLVAGAYTLTVTDANGTTGGCFATLPVTLTQPALPLSVVLTSQTNILCNGGATGAISVTASGGTPNYTYSWTGPNGFTSNTEDPTGLVAGAYILTVTDANGTTGGCLATLPVTLIQPALPLSQTNNVSVFPSGSNIQCFGGNNGSITLTVTGGTAGYTYNWTTINGSGIIQGNANQSSLTAGTYNVIITDANNCQINTTFTLVQPTDLVVNGTPFAYPSGNNISCFGEDDGSINLIPSGGAPGNPPNLYSYAWTGPGAFTSSSEDISNLIAGTYNVVVTDINNCTESISVPITQPTSIVLDTTLSLYPSLDNISCNGENDGTIDLIVNGGSPGYTYLWSTLNGGGAIPTQQDQAGLLAGTYNVIVTDINGCTANLSVTLVEPQALDVTVTPTVYSNGFNITGCDNNGAIDLTVTGGSPNYVYAWTANPFQIGLVPTAEDQTNLGPGLYSVLVTDINGCFIDIDTILLQAPLFNVTAQVISDYNGEDISCFGFSNGIVNANVIGGVPAYTFSWANVTSPNTVISTLQSPSTFAAGTYIVTVMDQDSCLASSTVSLQNPAPFVYDIAVSSNYNGQDISCFNASDGAIDLTFSGGTPGYTFQWTNANNVVVSSVEDPLNLPDGTYTALVTDINGCTFDTLITLTEPTILTGPATVTSDYNGADVSCFDATDGSVQLTITGGTPQYTTVWFDASTGTAIGSGQTLTGVGAGNYTVTVEDENGCDYTTTVTVTEPIEVTSSINVLTNYFGQAVSCVGEEDGAVQAAANGGTPGYSYSWSTTPVQSTQVAAGLGVGTVTLTVTDLNGCQSTSFINLSANPLPVVNLPDGSNTCVDIPVEIQAPVEPGGSASWVFSDGQSFNGFGPFDVGFAGQGCYDLQYELTNQFNCTSILNVEDYICVYPSPMASFTASPNTISDVDNVVSFDNSSQGASEYIWFFGDGSPYSTVENPIHEYDNIEEDFNELYFPVVLIAISEYGCIDSTLSYINYSPSLTYFVPNTFTPDGDDFNNVFKPVISTGFSYDKYEFLIFNRWGELIFETQDIGEGWDGTYKGQNCQDGTYTWKLVITNSTDASKIVDVGHVNLLRGGGDF